MPIDTKVLLDSYLTEMREHLDEITNTVNKLKEAPTNLAFLSNVLRQLHSIKGTSRLMGYTTVEKIAHRLEDILKGIRENRYLLSRNIIQLLFLSISLIHQALQHIETTSNDAIEIQPFLEAFEQAEHTTPFDLQKLSHFLQTATLSALNENKGINELEEISEIESIETIRVNLSSINAIIEKFDTAIIREFKLKNEIDLLRKEQTDSSLSSQRLKRQLKEDAELLESSIFETLHEVSLLRMLPLEIVFKPLRLSFETEIAKINKQINLIIPTTDIKLDKIILEQLSDILLHLMRNALDHGIETKSERKKLGKNETGNIEISTSQIENHIIISIKDDGKGLDYNKIRKTAIEKYPNQATEITKMPEQELQSFLFLSGFTTKEKTTALSGRGIGLDVVRTNLEKIKGQINIISEKNKGTEFKLTIPLTLSSQQGLFIYSGGYKLIIPSHYIFQIIEKKHSDFIQIGDQTLFRFQDSLIPVYNLAHLLSTQIDNNREVNKIIVVEYLNKYTGFIVDKIENYSSVVVKQFSRIFANFKPLQGVAFDTNYNFVPILNMPNIIDRTRHLLSYELKKVETKTKQKNYSILVVDDSYTTRQIEKSILEMEKYLVGTAENGIDALEKLKNNYYDLIIFDIKMPQMDGFSLARNIRRMDDYKNTPLIVVSSIYDEKVKKEFADIGVQKFIVKSDFERGNLVLSVKELLNEIN